MKRLISISAIAAVSVAVSACGSSSEVTGSGSGGGAGLSVSGTLNPVSVFATELSYDNSKLQIASSPLSGSLNPSNLLVSCVTFTVPPAVGTGGTVDSNGKFNVSFPADAKGKPFSCEIKPIDGSFADIPVVFVDATKRGLNGSSQANARPAVNDSIQIPAVDVDTNAASAQADVATLRDASGTTLGSAALAKGTGTKLNFTGEYTVESAASNGITLPTGYTDAQTIGAMFDSAYQNGAICSNGGGGGGGGPVIGQKIYLLRLAGHAFAPNNATTCQTAVDAAVQAANGPVSNATLAALLGSGQACEGTTSTDDMYGIMVWGPSNMSMEGAMMTEIQAVCASSETVNQAKTNLSASIPAISASGTFSGCGSKIGVTDAEAKIYGHVTLDSTAAPWSFGKFAFPDSIDMTGATAGEKSQYWGAASGFNAPPMQGTSYTSAVARYKFAKAQAQWTQNDCTNADVVIGSKTYPAWKCNGTYDADGPGAGAAVPAYRNNISRGCYIQGTGAPIQFDNWWTSSLAGGETTADYFYINNNNTGMTYNNLTAIDGTALPSGYHGQQNIKVGFKPKLHGSNVLSGAGTATVVCENYDGTFLTAGDTPITSFNYSYWAESAPAINAGDLCSTLWTAADTPAKKLRALRCYSQTYWNMRQVYNKYAKTSGSPATCFPEIRLNEAAVNPWDFEPHSGPDKASGEYIFEIFNYTANDAGSFTNQEMDFRGIRVGGVGGGDNWVNCAMRRNETILFSALNGNPNKVLVEITTVLSLVDYSNKACVAAQSDLGIGTSKQMFVMSK